MATKRIYAAIRGFVNELDIAVFSIGFSATLVAIILFIVYPKTSKEWMQRMNKYLWSTYGWVYLLLMFTMLIFSVLLLFSRWGDIKLGRPDESPEFTLFEFFAMMFSTGIAAGIVFWGPAEALFHYREVPPLIDAQPNTAEAAVGAVQYTLFHWGFYYLIPYLIVGIPIAYFAYRYDAPIRISTILAPFIGLDNLNGYLAKSLDILSVFSTVGGITTTLGFVGNQLLIGFEYETGIVVGNLETILVITGLTIIFTLSAVLGLKRGIRVLSIFNVLLFLLLGAFTFIVGPTNYIMGIGLPAVGGYISDFFRMSLYTGITSESGWVGSWTVFYWAWVFSWAPFGGLFVARISRGRTVREVTIATLLGSTVSTLPWFYIMGGTAIWLQKTGTTDILSKISENGVAVSGYVLFEALPLGSLTSILFAILVVSFFVTSADSSTLALGMLTTGGKESPSDVNRVIWGGLMGALASLLITIGGINALRSLAIITGLLFAIIAVVAIASTSVEFYDLEPIIEDSNEESHVADGETDVK